MKQRIRVAAIIVKDDQVLLVKHVHPENGFEWWVPPGGGLEEIDKSIHECAIRETWEETGYDIRTTDILYLREFIDLENEIYNLELFLKGEIISGELTIKNIQGNGPDEHYIKEVRWIDKAEIIKTVVFPEIIKKEEFWNDQKNIRTLRYLGRDEG